MPDRRHHRRYPRQLRVIWKNQQLAFAGLTRDICMGGVFIITDHLFPRNSTLNLEISFGFDDSVLQCRGRIAWINAGQVETCPPGFGVEFVEVDEQMLAQLFHELRV